MGHALHISVPGIETLIHRKGSANEPAQLFTKFLWGNAAAFKIAKDTLLTEWIEMLTGILKTNLLKTANGVIMTQGDNYATKVECNVTNRIHGERNTGIEPASQAWEARALPMC